MRHLVSCHRFAALLAIVLLSQPAIAAEPTQVTPAELAGDQNRGANRLSELESRLHALAMMLREDEPENAGRLMLALRASRRDQIREEMTAIQQLLQGARTAQAATRADKLIAQLEELREVLTAPDIRFRLQLERLRSLLKSKESLDAIAAAQQRMREDAAAAAKKAAAAAAAQAKQGAMPQDDLGNRTAELNAAMAASMAGTPQTQKAVGDAESAMRQAASSLGSGQPGEAVPQQDRALASLQKANSDLEEKIDQLRQEMEAGVRAAVMAALKAMLTDEDAVIAATSAGEFQAAVVDRQRRVADETKQITTLIVETDYSAALPIVLNEIALDARKSAADLANTIPVQKRIAATLRDLIKTLEDRPPPAPQSDQQSDPQSGQQQEQQQQLQKLIAELKMLHFLETRVIKDTVAADSAENRRAAADLRRRQVAILDALRALQEELKQQ